MLHPFTRGLSRPDPVPQRSETSACWGRRRRTQSGRLGRTNSGDLRLISSPPRRGSSSSAGGALNEACVPLDWYRKRSIVTDPRPRDVNNGVAGRSRGWHGDLRTVGGTSSRTANASGIPKRPCMVLPIRSFSDSDNMVIRSVSDYTEDSAFVANHLFGSVEKPLRSRTTCIIADGCLGEGVSQSIGSPIRRGDEVAVGATSLPN